MKQHFLILGGYKEIHKYLYEFGAKIDIAIDKKYYEADSIYNHVITADEENELCEYIKKAMEINEKEPYDMIVATTEYYQEMCVLIAKKLGVACNVDEIAFNLLKDKAKMRECLKCDKRFATNYWVINQNEKINYEQILGYPLICKPSRGQGSRAIYTVSDKIELMDVINNANEELILEPFFEGVEISVESFLINGKHFLIQVTDKYKMQNFVEKGHCQPALLGTNQIETIDNYMSAFFEIIKYNNGPAHTEVILNKEGIKIVESHTRLGGDNIPMLIKMTKGVDIFEIWAKQIIGKQITSKDFPKESKCYAAVFYKTVNEDSYVEKIDCRYKNAKIFVKEGESLKKTTSSGERYGYYIVKSKKRDEAINNAMKIEKIIKTRYIDSKYQIRQMNEDDKEYICKWKYENQYEIYNLPDYKEMKKDGIGFANSQRIDDYYVIEYGDLGVVSFFGLIDEGKEVFVGLGVHPKYCSQGIGKTTLKKAIEINKKRSGKKRMYLEVRTWNQRAISCYKKTGFYIVGDTIYQQTYVGQGTFYRMQYDYIH